MEKNSFLFTSESVTEGHPDKICDQISDAILDAIIKEEIALAQSKKKVADGNYADPRKARCACETLATAGLVMVSGEVRTKGYVDVPSVVRKVLNDIGYNRAKFGFDAETCGVINTIHGQSPDIALGVDESIEVKSGLSLDKGSIELGAGDQGMVFGYACNDTKALMPLPIYIAHRLSEKLTHVRKQGILPFLRPDGKTQVSVKYENGHPKEIETILISSQHSDSVDNKTLTRELKNRVIDQVIEEEGLTISKDFKSLINPTGRFVIGGPAGDTGLTGRKIIVDTYGGMGKHGGGAFSGKDFTKVDRSGAYAARWVAKNVVASGLAERCEIQIAYAIGVATPVSIMVDCFETNVIPVKEIKTRIQKTFDLTPDAIIDSLDLIRPIYQKTATYGHFGRELPEFTWEKTNKIADLLV